MTLPASIVAGNTLIVLIRVAVAGVIGWPAGWTELFDASSDGADDQMAAAWRKADGTEGSTITLSSASGKFAAIAWNIAGATDPTVTPPQLSTVATGASTAPNPTTNTPTGGAKDYLWLWAGGWENEQTSPPASNPTSYTLNVIGANSGTAGVVTTNCRVAGAGRQLNAASEDPGSWTISVSDDWTAYTIAVHPAPPGTTDGVGSSAGVATVAAIGAAFFISVAAAAGLATGPGVGAATSASSGTSAGAGAASGVGTGILSSSASAAGVADATAVGFAFQSGAGSAAGTATAAAAGISTAASPASSAGTGAATGVGVATAAAAASSDGAGAGAGIGAGTAAAASSSAGTSTAAGVATSTAAAAGTSSGVATAAGEGEAVGTGSVGAAAGTSSAPGVGAAFSAGLASSAGTSDAPGVGSSTAVSAASAAGAAAAAAIGEAVVDRWLTSPPSFGPVEFVGRRRRGRFGPY